MAAADVDLAQWLALRRAGLGSTSFRRLILGCGSIADAREAPVEALRAAGLDAQYVRGFQKARREFAPDRELEALHEHGVRAYTWQDKD